MSTDPALVSVLVFIATLLCVTAILVPTLYAAWHPSSGSASVAVERVSFGENAIESLVECPLHERRFDAELHRMAAALRAAGPVHLLSQESFAAGTVRVREPGTYRLVEDVEFVAEFRRDLADAARAEPYTGRAFTLGFFAALSIESPNVVIDLNGHSLAQERVHAAVEQRFFSLIELGPAPFVAGQGPTDFGPAVDTVDGLVIENGHLGRSSHHALHGNGGRRVLLRNVTMRDYEVAAIALNGFEDVLIDAVHAQGTYQHVETLGTLSNAQFALPAARRLADAVAAAQPPTIAATADAARLRALTATLQARVDEAVDDVRVHGAIDAQRHPAAHALFANPGGAVDGNAYALLLHPRGVAVGAFHHARTPPDASPLGNRRIAVRRSTFNATRAAIVEVVALQDANGRLVRGPFGDVVRLVDNTPESDARALFATTGTDGQYRGTALSDVQLAMSHACRAYLSPGDERDALCGTAVAGDPRLDAWARGTRTLRALIEDDGYAYVRNGDTMSHVNKGVVAVRVDGARDVCFDQVRITHSVNGGLGGQVTALPGERDNVEAAYVGRADGGHPDQARGPGYMGADVRALSVAASTRIFVRNTHAEHTHARLGNARGIDVFNYANWTHFSGEVHVSNVTTLVDDEDAVLGGHFANGPRVGQAIGLRATAASSRTMFGGGCVFARAIASRVLEQALERAVDSVHDYLDDDSEGGARLNPYRV